jgi:peptide subunit release factor 1 (eRF1)
MQGNERLPYPEGTYKCSNCNLEATFKKWKLSKNLRKNGRNEICEKERKMA